MVREEHLVTRSSGVYRFICFTRDLWVDCCIYMIVLLRLSQVSRLRCIIHINKISTNWAGLESK